MSHDYINGIKNKVISFFGTKTDDIMKDLINFCYIDINKNDITSLIYPIHYLFDSYINDEIGNTSSNTKKIRDILNLDEITGLNPDNIFTLEHPSHITLIYKFDINKKNYIYYSNSGFGGQNHILDIEKNNISGIAPKIFKITNSDSNSNSNSNSDNKLRDKIIDFIRYIINEINIINISYFEIDRNTKKRVIDEIFKDIEKHINTIGLDALRIDFSKFEIICKEITEDKLNGLQKLIYTLFNYVLIKLQIIYRKFHLMI